MAQLALAAAGSYLGSAAISGTVMGMSGAAIGWAAGSLLGGVLFPPKMPNGPRLDDLTVQVSAYGQAIPRLWGTMRLAGNIIWASDLTERKSEQGGKGGSSYTTYNYSCSIAIALCEGVITGVSRIWADGKLIYDIRPVNTGNQKSFVADSFVIYTGTEDQEVDPTIQALMTDAPAYRGIAYVVFTELRLEKWGNRIPNLTFEVVKDGVFAREDPHQFGPYYGDEEGGSTLLKTARTDDGRLWIARKNPAATVESWDPLTEQRISPPNEIPDDTHVAPDGGTYTHHTAEGSVMAYGTSFLLGRGQPGPARLDGINCPSPIPNCGEPQPYTHGWRFFPGGRHAYTDRASSGQFQNAFYWPGCPIVVTAKDGNVYCDIASENGITSTLAMRFNLGGGVPGNMAICLCAPSKPPSTFTEPYSLVPGWAFKSFWAGPYGTVVMGYNTPNGAYIRSTGNAAAPEGAMIFAGTLPGSSVQMPTSCYDPIRQCVWTFAGDDFNLLYRNADFTGFSGPPYGGLNNRVLGVCIDTATGLLRVFQDDQVGGSSYLSLMNPDTGDILETITYTSPSVNSTWVPGNMWDMPERGACLFTDSYSIWVVPYGTTLDPRPVLLSEVVTDLSVASGLTVDDIDVTELTDEVLGYVIPRQSSSRAAIEQLMIAYMFDAVESEGKVKFVKRGRPPVRDLEYEDLAAHEYGSERPTPLMLRRADEAELPKVIGVRYIERANDYQTSVQEARRQTGRARIESSLDAPVVLTPEHAKAVADLSLYSSWVARTKCEWSTTLEHADLEPTDVIRISGNVINIVHKARAGNIIRWRGEFDSGVQLVAGAVAGEPYIWGGGSGIEALPLTELILLDIPLLADVDNYVGLYYAGSPYSQDVTWPGAVLYQSAPGGAATSPIRLIETAATWGATLNALPDVGNYNMMDERHALRVSLVRGSLTSASYSEVLSGANVLLVGNEILQYRTATAELDGTVTLTGLLRGRKGTLTSGHFAGERVVLLQAPAVSRLLLADSDIGILRSYRSVTSGATIESAPNVAHVHAAVAQKPLRLVHVASGRDAASNIRIQWVRRARYDAEWRDSVDAALGETSETYRVDVYEDATYTVVVRSFTVTGQTYVDYTAAQQIDDWGGYQPEVFVRTWQVSGVVGAGFTVDATL